MYRLFMTITLMLAMAPISQAYPEMQKKTENQQVAEKVFENVDPAAFTTGEILEIIQVQTYTYIRLRADQTKNEIWLATGKKELKKGQRIRFKPSEALKDFHSPTLDRTFKEIQFISSVEVAKKRG